MQHLSQRFLAQKIFTHPWKWRWTKKRARMKLGPEMETCKSSSITSSIVIIPTISSSSASFGSGLSAIWRISPDGVRDHHLDFTDPLSSSYVWPAGKLFHFWNSLLFGKGLSWATCDEFWSTLIFTSSPDDKQASITHVKKISKLIAGKHNLSQSFKRGHILDRADHGFETWVTRKWSKLHWPTKVFSYRTSNWKQITGNSTCSYSSNHCSNLRQQRLNTLIIRLMFILCNFSYTFNTSIAFFLLKEKRHAFEVPCRKGLCMFVLEWHNIYATLCRYKVCTGVKLALASVEWKLELRKGSTCHVIEPEKELCFQCQSLGFDIKNIVSLNSFTAHFKSIDIIQCLKQPK